MALNSLRPGVKPIKCKKDTCKVSDVSEDAAQDLSSLTLFGVAYGYCRCWGLFNACIYCDVMHRNEYSQTLVRHFNLNVSWRILH